MAHDVLTFRAGKLIRGGEPWVPERPFLAVIGQPVSHSLSPIMHQAALTARGLEHEYLPIELASEDLPAFKKCPGIEHLVGFNVTAPHKESVVGLCDNFTEAASLLGVVNTVGRDAAGLWVGHNSDGGGLRMVLAQAWGEHKPKAEAVVLGTGGAARAAVDALWRWGSHHITVKYHTPVARDRFTQWLSQVEYGEQVELEPLGPANHPGSPPAAVWINALARHVRVTPFLPDAAGADRSLFIDLRYGEDLVAENYPLGFSIIDGLPLLVMQGGLSFAWWFGPPVPWDEMRKVL